MSYPDVIKIIKNNIKTLNKRFLAEHNPRFVDLRFVSLLYERNHIAGSLYYENERHKKQTGEELTATRIIKIIEHRAERGDRSNALARTREWLEFANTEEVDHDRSS